MSYQMWMNGYYTGISRALQSRGLLLARQLRSSTPSIAQQFLLRRAKISIHEGVFDRRYQDVQVSP